MAENKFLTPDIIAQEALMILESNTVMAAAVYRDYEREFGPAKVGDTISIRKPAVFEAKEFVDQITVQDAKEGRVALTLDKHLDVSTAVSSREWTLELNDFSNRIIRPAMIAINEKIDSYLCGLYAQFNQAAGTAGTQPTTLAALAQLDQAMNEARIPVANRYVVVSPATKAALFNIPEMARADARCDEGTALREASMGRLMSCDWFMDQNIKSHKAGTAQTDAALAVNGEVAAGLNYMAADGASGSATLNAGDLFSVAGVKGTFTVLEKATAQGGAFGQIRFSPETPAGGFADNAAITVEKSHVANLAFVREAIALAVVPLELPMGAAAENASYMSHNGLGIRVIRSYDIIHKTDTISFDALLGAKVINPNLGVRFMA